MNNTLILTDDNFESTIKENKIVLVDFWATWCGPCKMFAPIIDEISKEYQDAKIAKCDIEEAPNATAKSAISSVPTIIIFKNGEEVKRFNGVKSKSFIIDELKKLN